MNGTNHGTTATATLRYTPLTPQSHYANQRQRTATPAALQKVTRPDIMRKPWFVSRTKMNTLLIGAQGATVLGLIVAVANLYPGVEKSPE